MKDNLSRLPAAIDRAIHEASIRRKRKRLEEQLRQAQRMEAVRLFAGGMAHDFNNILTAIIGYGSLLRSLMHSEDPLCAYVDQILSASHKAANLTQSLVTYSRKQVLNVQPVDVNTVIENTGQLLSHIMGQDIELRISLYPKPLQVMAHRGHLEQFLMNLATNSRDVVPDGGQFHISTQLGRMPGLPGDGGSHGVNQDCVVISVKDTDWGMDQTVKSKIFEPFFTTKEAERGTGLGLAVVHGIIKQHKGHIEVDSRPKTGKVFRLYLPVVETHAPQTENRRGEGLAIGGSETILVAEDSDAFRNLVVDIL